MVVFTMSAVVQPEVAQQGPDVVHHRAGLLRDVFAGPAPLRLEGHLAGNENQPAGRGRHRIGGQSGRGAGGGENALGNNRLLSGVAAKEYRRQRAPEWEGGVQFN